MNSVLCADTMNGSGILNIILSRSSHSSPKVLMLSLMKTLLADHSVLSLSAGTGTVEYERYFWLFIQTSAIASVVFSNTLFLLCQLINLSPLGGAVAAHKSQFVTVNGVSIFAIGYIVKCIIHLECVSVYVVCKFFVLFLRSASRRRKIFNSELLMICS